MQWTQGRDCPEKPSGAAGCASEAYLGRMVSLEVPSEENPRMDAAAPTVAESLLSPLSFLLECQR